MVLLRSVNESLVHYLLADIVKSIDDGVWKARLASYDVIRSEVLLLNLVYYTVPVVGSEIMADLLLAGT